MQAPERILLSRANPGRTPLAPIIAEARLRYPGSRIDWLTPEEESVELRPGEKVFFHSGAFPSWDNLTDATRKELRRRRHDLFILAVADDLGVRAFGARLLPLRARIPAIELLNHKLQARRFNQKEWLANTAAAESFWRVWVAVRQKADEAAATAWLRALPAVRRVMEAAPHESLEGRKLRVVIFTHSMGVGGVQKQIFELLRGMDRSRFDPTLVLLVKDSGFFEPEVRALGIPIVHVYPIQPEDQFFTLIARDLARVLRRIRPDVVHTYMPLPNMLGAMAAPLSGARRNLLSVRALRVEEVTTWSGPQYQTFDTLASRAVDHIVCNSNAVADYYTKWAGVPRGRIDVVYNGIAPGPYASLTEKDREDKRAELGMQPGEVLALQVGRLSMEKQVHVFVDALRLARSKAPNLRGVVAGGGPEMAGLTARAGDLIAAGAIRFLGERRDVRQLLAAADIVVLTSMVEGMPNVLIEAAHAGKPSIATACGGAQEVVRHGVTGYVTPVGAVEEIAERLAELAQQPELRKRMGEAARARGQKIFNPERMVAETVRLYE
ncbi:MAG: D-inositol-3-phosphate glycosyltransferase [Myxococcota bacterium]|nr:D-inositol-3-phosphate glycosyltransferase [Myxococcota bacterium]